MRCFISLDFSGGRNPMQTTVGNRGLNSSQNREAHSSGTARSRGPWGQQVVALPAACCVWPHTLLPQAGRLHVWGQTAWPAPATVGAEGQRSLRASTETHQRDSERPDFGHTPTPRQGRDRARDRAARRLSSLHPSLPI